MNITPGALLITGGILICMIAIAWWAIWYGRPEETLKPIDWSKKK